MNYPLTNIIYLQGICIIYEFTNNFKRRRAQSIVGRVTFLLIAAICMVYGRWKLMGGTKPQFKQIDNPAAFAENTFVKVYLPDLSVKLRIECRQF